MSGFLTRCRECVLPFFLGLDIFACVIWLSLLYPFGLARKPTGREMISSYIGYCAFTGANWAVEAAKVLDWCACKLGDKPNHAQRAYLNYKGLDL